ncbi:epoxyqueuosine reductase QueH [bacterium]|nr:epoxyqueuosine reductase QueH [bacterium]
MSEMPGLLLHVCCGPCATAVVERLSERFRVTMLWYNPNLEPDEEHDLRLAQARKVAEHLGCDLVVIPPDEEGWLQAVSGHEADPEGGERCRLCYEYRLRRTAQEAVERGFGTVATTLTVSPHKSAAVINEIGRQVTHGVQASFLAEDFKKQNGFLRSLELSREWELYRQRYCGCRFSQR